MYNRRKLCDKICFLKLGATIRFNHPVSKLKAAEPPSLRLLRCVNKFVLMPLYLIVNLSYQKFDRSSIADSKSSWPTRSESWLTPSQCRAVPHTLYSTSVPKYKNLKSNEIFNLQYNESRQICLDLLGNVPSNSRFLYFWYFGYFETVRVAFRYQQVIFAL